MVEEGHSRRRSEGQSDAFGCGSAQCKHAKTPRCQWDSLPQKVQEVEIVVLNQHRWPPSRSAGLLATIVSSDTIQKNL